MKNEGMKTCSGHNWTKASGEPLPPLDFSEWDFRRITEALLYVAILYEYARSCPWIRELFNKWHEQKINLPKESEDFKKWSGMKIRNVLNHLLLEILPVDVGSALTESIPEAFSGSVSEVAWISDFQFPTPFLDLPPVEPESFQFLNRHSRRNQPAFRIVKPTIHIFNTLLAQHNNPEKRPMTKRLVLAEVDLTSGNVLPVQDFGKWLKKLPQLKIGRGKARAFHWHELKELAAYRLSKIGLTYKEAQTQVKERREKHPFESHIDVLPTYNASGFSDAVKSAEARIKEMFESPS